MYYLYKLDIGMLIILKIYLDLSRKHDSSLQIFNLIWA